MKLYPIGKHIKIQVEFSNQIWYLPDVIMVIGYCRNSKREIIYRIDRILPEYDNSIHYGLVYSDDECNRLDRKIKLERLNNHKDI